MSIPVDKIMSVDEQTLAESGFYWRERDGVRVLVCKPMEAAGFVNGFSTRVGGVSDFPADSLNLAGFDEDSAENIHENRSRFQKVFDSEYKLATAWQVHGDGVKMVKNDDDIANSDDKFDALVSDMPRTMAGVKTADCVPVLIGDLRTKAFAAIHAGWRGTVRSIAVRAIETMQREYGGDPENFIAAIGPCASGTHYEIGDDVIDAFEKSFSTCGKYFKPTREGHALIDLPLANKDQLISCGVPLDRIYTAPFCTIERTDLFFSYRVEKRLHGKTGRSLSVIGIR